MVKPIRSRGLQWLFFLVVLSLTTVFGKTTHNIISYAKDRTRRATEDFRIRRNVESYIHVSGRITFKGKTPGTIPPNSRLIVKLIDIKLADASHIELASISVDLTNYKSDRPVFYNLTSKRPSDLHDMHSIEAVLNMGWMPKGGENDEWLRHGDYHTTHSFMVNMTSATDKFVQDIEMEMFTSSLSAAVVLGKYNTFHGPFEEI